MARINVDDKWLKDPRRDDFVKAVGDSDRADGLTVRYWRLGQEAHAQGKLVNKKQFMRMPFAKEFMACELAEEREGGIYIKGTKRRAKYLVAKIEAGRKGGKKSATRDRDERGRLRSKRKGSESQPSTAPSKTQAPPNEAKPHVHSHTHVQFQLQTEEETKTACGSAKPVSLPAAARPPKRFDAEDLGQVLSAIPKKTADVWLTLYNGEQDWVERELLKAWKYYAIEHPSKKPKSISGWSRAFGSWLERGWGYRAKGIRTGGVRTRQDATADHLSEMMSKVERGEL